MVLIMKAAFDSFPSVFLARLLKFSTVAMWLVRHEVSITLPSDYGEGIGGL